MTLDTNAVNVPRSPITQPIREFSFLTPASGGDVSSVSAYKGVNGILKSVLRESGNIPNNATYTINIIDRHGVTRWTSGLVTDQESPPAWHNAIADDNEVVLSGLVQVQWALVIDGEFTAGLGKVVIEVAKD